jgi:serine protease Do
MKRFTFVLALIFALLIGYLAGSRLDFFKASASVKPYTYNIELPVSITGKGPAFSDVVKVISPTVVNISTTKTIKKREGSPFSHLFDSPLEELFAPFSRQRQWKEQSLGSGVVVSSDGYIITNNHVVEKADEIRVKLLDQRDFDGKIVGSDPKTDLAVIKIAADNLPAIKWGNSDDLQVGEFVLAFGNPYSFGHTVTMGIVSAVGRANVGIADYEDFIQTDAAINPGNSGGPLVNIKGELIGINTAIFSRTGGYQGIGFAVPSNMARSVMTQLIEKGKVTRGWLGVTIQNFTPELAREFGLKKAKGALVTEIHDRSPAARAGLKRGDVILELNGKEVKNVESMRNMVAQSKVGSRISMRVLRDGKTITLVAKVAELPSRTEPAGLSEREHGPSEDEGSFAGFSVMNLTRNIAKQLDLPKNEKGVVIVKVEPYSAAEDAGLKKGDVIQEINKKKIDDMDDFNRVKRTLGERETLLLFINRSGSKFFITLKPYS